MVRTDHHPLAYLHLFGEHDHSSISLPLTLTGDAGDLAQRPMARASALPFPESSQRKNPNPPRVLLEGGGGLEFLRHDYCYISCHQCKYRVLKHRLGATSMVTLITKRTGLLCSQRSVRFFVVGGYERGDRRPLRLEASGPMGAGCQRCWIRSSENSVKAKFAEHPFRNCLENRDGSRIGAPKAVNRDRRSPNRPFPWRQEARPRRLWLFSKQFLHAFG
jgi:hypothetical protein